MPPVGPPPRCPLRSFLSLSHYRWWDQWHKEKTIWEETR